MNIFENEFKYIEQNLQKSILLLHYNIHRFLLFGNL